MSTWDPSGPSWTATPGGVYTAWGSQGPPPPGVFRVRQVAAPASYREPRSAESNNTAHNQPTCLSKRTTGKATILRKAGISSSCCCDYCFK